VGCRSASRRASQDGFHGVQAISQPLGSAPHGALEGQILLQPGQRYRFLHAPPVHYTCIYFIWLSNAIFLVAVLCGIGLLLVVVTMRGTRRQREHRSTHLRLFEECHKGRTGALCVCRLSELHDSVEKKFCLRLQLEPNQFFKAPKGVRSKTCM